MASDGDGVGCAGCSVRPSRRAFLGAGAALTAAATLGATATLSGGCASVPAVEFAAGTTGELAVGERRFLEEHSVFLVHGDQGYAAISAICTHLGCRLGEDAGGGGYECGCHGSRFAADGSVVEGPADEPLTWYAVRVDGAQIFVDGGKPVPAGTWTAG